MFRTGPRATPLHVGGRGVMFTRNQSLRSHEAWTGSGSGLVAMSLLLVACGDLPDRREFGDAYVPPAETLGNFDDGAADGEPDEGDDDDDDDDDTVPEGDSDDGGAVDDGPLDDDGADDHGADDSADDQGLDEGGSEGGTDDGIPEDDGGEDIPPESPYTGGWDIGTCQSDITPSGTGVGQVVPDFSLTDQFGDSVRLHDFCHKAVLLTEGSFW